MDDIECVVWCAHCSKDKFRVERKPTRVEGVYTHECHFFADTIENRITCADCGGQLSRKEDHG